MRYLIFDLSDGDDGVQTLEAMASTRGDEHAAVLAEVDRVLGWAAQAFADGPGPVEDGAAWDSELLVQQEAGGWQTVTLTLSGTAAFVEAFGQRFGGDTPD